MSYIKYKKSTFFVHVSTQDYVDKFFLRGQNVDKNTFYTECEQVFRKF